MSQSLDAVRPAAAQPSESRALLPAELLQPPPLPPLDMQLEAAIKSPPVGRLVRLSILVLSLSLIPFFGWAALTTMEQAVLASGSVIPEGRRKTVNLLESGIVRRMLVREGDTVEANQPLLQLDVTQAESIADQARAAYWGGRAKAARLRAEAQESRELTFPEDLRRAGAGDPRIQVFLDAEQALFRARWSNFDGQIAVAERQSSQFAEQIAGARAQREAALQQLRSAREQLTGMRTLAQQGLLSQFRLQEMQRLEQNLIGSAGAFAAQETQFREAMAQAQSQLAGLSLTRLSDVATELQVTEAAVATAQQQLRAAQDVLTRREVLSPEAGKVTNVRAFTPGSTIVAAEPILDIVPLRDRFIIDAQIAPVDIEQVSVGQRANVRLSSYRMRSVPLISGRVTTVSADAQTNPQGQTFFTLKVELDQADLDKLPEVILQAGMPAEVYVLGEQRTPLDYLWAPIRNSARRAFRD